jgi:sulfate/thiosulfate transport system substrate-binding protein
MARRRLGALAVALAFAVGLALLFGGCTGRANRDTLINVSYDPTRELYEDINTAFVARQKAKGRNVEISQSHAGSGGQARSVIEGLEADVVTLALASDIDAVAAKGLIAADWQKRLPDESCPYTSTIVFVVRAGNPKGIEDWSDLAKPDIRVVTPNPKTSGGARWNFLAAWGYATIGQKMNEEAAKELVGKIYKNVIKLDTGARGATETFAKRKQGDVLIAWENDAVLARREVPEAKLELVYPSISVKAEPPVAVVDKIVDAHGTRELAEEYLRFLYTPEAQDIIGKNSYRPTDPAFLKKYAGSLPAMPMFTIRDVAGSWPEAQKRFFADGGVFDEVYQPKGKR